MQPFNRPNYFAMPAFQALATDQHLLSQIATTLLSINSNLAAVNARLEAIEQRQDSIEQAMAVHTERLEEVLANISSRNIDEPVVPAANGPIEHGPMPQLFCEKPRGPNGKFRVVTAGDVEAAFLALGKSQAEVRTDIGSLHWIVNKTIGTLKPEILEIKGDVSASWSALPSSMTERAIETVETKAFLYPPNVRLSAREDHWIAAHLLSQRWNNRAGYAKRKSTGKYVEYAMKVFRRLYPKDAFVDREPRITRLCLLGRMQCHRQRQIQLVHRLKSVA